MDPQDFEQTPEKRTLKKIQQGMQVIDVTGKPIGHVEFVHMGADAVSGAGAADYARIPEKEKSLMENLAEAINPEDRLPETVQNRLLFDGFVRVDSSVLFHADRYIVPDQVDRIEGDFVVLNVSYDDLVH